MRRRAPSFTTTIADADGRRVPLVAHEIRTAFAGDERSVRLRAALERPAPPMTRREWLDGAGWGLLAIPLMLATGMAPAALSFGLQAPWWVLVLLAVPLGLLPAIVTVILTRRVAGARIARVHLVAGYCPSCGHDFGPRPWSGAPRQRCPECGATWEDPLDHECRPTLAPSSGQPPRRER